MDKLNWIIKTLRAWGVGKKNRMSITGYAETLCTCAVYTKLWSTTHSAKPFSAGRSIPETENTLSPTRKHPPTLGRLTESSTAVSTFGTIPLTETSAESFVFP